jgi:hypothetical protein
MTSPLFPSRPRNGLIEIKIRRCLVRADRASTTTELVREIYPRPHAPCHYNAVRRAARKFAIESGRERKQARGRPPILWQLKPPGP